MYTTVQQCHIAIDFELQQVNSNRKQSIDPNYYDIALNEAVIQFVETRSSSKGNIKREGFEESQKRYDDLKNLKTQTILKCLYDPEYYQRAYCIIPSDYVKLIPSEIVISYNKEGINEPALTSVNINLLKYDLSSFEFNTHPTIKLGLGNNQVDVSSAINTIKTDNGRFYAINVILDTLRRLGYSVYYETFDNIYNPQTLIITSKIGENIVNPIVGIPLTSTDSISVKTFANYPNKQSSLDLLSTGDVRNSLDNYHASRNRHLKPISDIIGNRVNVYYNDNFTPVNFVFNYIKKPRLIDHITNTMCEITVTQELIKLAVLHLKGILKDEGYNISANEKIINE